MDELLHALAARRGHFRLESGHHGDLWLDMERLCLQPNRLQRLAHGIAPRLRTYAPEAICAPLIEGAFVGQLVALELGIPFTYAERIARPESTGLFAVEYRIPTSVRSELASQRVAVINDVTNAGSAVRGTIADLQSVGAQTVVIGSLAVLGEIFQDWCVIQRIPLETLATLPNALWPPSECPLCATGLPLEDLSH